MQFRYPVPRVKEPLFGYLRNVFSLSKSRIK